MTTTAREATQNFDKKGFLKDNPRSLKIEISKARKEITRLRKLRTILKMKEIDFSKISTMIKSEIRRLALLQDRLSKVDIS